MKQYFISQRARADLQEIWDFVARNNPEAADRLIEKILEPLRLLAELPGMGRNREELAPNLRSFPIGKHILYYRLREEGIDVIRILHGARDVRGLFEE